MMARPPPPWARLVELSIGVAGDLPAWEKNEADDTWVSWVQETGGVCPKVVQVRAASLRPLGGPGAYRRVPRRGYGLDGQIREGS